MRSLVVLAVICAIAFAVKKCPENEEWTECGTACEPKCNEPLPEVCTLNCIVDVCQCKQGYKRGPKGCLKEGSPDCK
ncbi:hypothetical protein Aduo_018133 [Ancylostoma duodenale]